MLLLLLLAACGGGGGGGGEGGNGGTQRPGNLEGTLDRLGVDTSKTPRQTEPGHDVPPEYAPLGSRIELARTDELLLLGLAPRDAGTDAPVTLFELTGETGGSVRELLHAVEDADAPWARESHDSRSFPASLRTAIAADVDGDGHEEALIFHQDGVETHVMRIGYAPQAYVRSEAQIATLTGVTNVAAAAGDLDGDGDDEVLLGFTRDGAGLLMAFDQSPQGLVEVGTARTFEPTVAGGTLVVRLCTGNLDDDRAHEVGMTISEYLGTTGAARFWVFDDLGRDLATLRASDFTARDQRNVLQTGRCAGIAIGDIDGDNLGEIVVSGVTRRTAARRRAPCARRGP